MNRTLACTLLLLSATWNVAAQPGVQLSHIEANVPSQDNFETLLKRDLLAFMRVQGGPSATRVEYKLLRDGPTQSGVAYPKFYAWVQAFAGAQLISEGVVRLAAVERQRFDVTDYVRAKEVRANPDSVRAIFPKVLVPVILERAGGK